MTPSISDDAVRDATGRGWDEWFTILARAEEAAASGVPATDASEAADSPEGADLPSGTEERESGSPDAPTLDHKALVAYLRSQHPDLSGWWRQTVVVEYEKAAGRRVTGETADTGFQIGVQKTISAPPDRVWAVLDPVGLAGWLGDGVQLTLDAGATYGDDEAGDGPSGEVRVVVPGQRVRLTWQPGDWPRASTIQVRVTPKDDGRSTVGIHHEHLPDQSARDAMRVRWKAALEELARQVES